MQDCKIEHIVDSFGTPGTPSGRHRDAIGTPSGRRRDAVGTPPGRRRVIFDVCSQIYNLIVQVTQCMINLKLSRIY